MSGFIKGERAAQAAFFDKDDPDRARRGDRPWRLAPGSVGPNLAPCVRDELAGEAGQFARLGIVWHRHADHGLSSQACCLNFLAPLARRPDLLSRVVGSALGIAPPRMLPVEEGPGGAPWFVGFEWTGGADHLGEWPKGGTATRGANATSADAFVRFESEGREEALLVEWKYTESYGAPLDPGRDGRGHETRARRYGPISFAPEGPIRSDLGLRLEDFHWEPFYQLLRQQVLAHRMQAAGEAARARVLHISPRGNLDLHRVTSPALAEARARLLARGEAVPDDAFALFRALLVDPGAFVSRATDEAFGPALAAARQGDRGARAWAAYLDDRYASILPAPTSPAA